MTACGVRGPQTLHPPLTDLGFDIWPAVLGADASHLPHLIKRSSMSPKMVTVTTISTGLGVGGRVVATAKNVHGHPVLA